MSQSQALTCALPPAHWEFIVCREKVLLRPHIRGIWGKGKEQRSSFIFSLGLPNCCAERAEILFPPHGACKIKVSSVSRLLAGDAITTANTSGVVLTHACAFPAVHGLVWLGQHSHCVEACERRASG